MPRYLEDLREGDRFVSGPRTVTQDEIVAFADQFDPQPFHLDPDAAKASFFGRLVASGWHTTAIMMRLMVESDLDLAGGIVGFAMEKLRWPAPLEPGTTIHAQITIVRTRVSESRPGFGIVRFRTEVVGDDGKLYLELLGDMFVRRRPTAQK